MCARCTMPKMDISAQCLNRIYTTYYWLLKTVLNTENRNQTWIQSFTIENDHQKSLSRDCQRDSFILSMAQENTETHKRETFRFSLTEMKRCDRCHHHRHCCCCCHCNRQQNETQNYFSINFRCCAGHIDCFHIMRLKMQ